MFWDKLNLHLLLQKSVTKHRVVSLEMRLGWVAGKQQVIVVGKD